MREALFEQRRCIYGAVRSAIFATNMLFERFESGTPIDGFQFLTRRLRLMSNLVLQTMALHENVAPHGDPLAANQRHPIL